MGTKYSTNLPTGYNVSPPSDDGATTAANKVQWSTIKTKLTDCFNTWAASLNTAILNAFDTSCTSLTGNYTTLASDNARTLQCSGTFTVSLGDASTLAAGWFCNIVNAGTGTITIGRATGGNTLGGVASNITLAPLQATTVIVNQAANGFNLLDCNSLLIDNTDTTKQARHDLTSLPTATTAVLKIAAAQVVEGNQGTNVVSASTINLDTATGDYVHVTGTTTITAITLTQGRERTVVFDGALTLTNGGSLVLPGGSNITTAAGDSMRVRGEAAGVVRVVSYTWAVGLSSSQGSSLVLLQAQTASSSATIQFTSGITSAYNEYLFVLAGVVPATNNVQLNLNMSINGGSSYDTGGSSYSSAMKVLGANNTDYSAASATTSNVGLNGVTNLISNTSTSAGWSGEVRLFRPSSATDIKMVKVNGLYAGTVALAAVDGAGAGISAGLSGSAVNAVNFQMSAGNIASGLFYLYGVKKS